MPSDDNQPRDGAAVAKRMRAEHARLEALLANFSDEELVQPGRFGEWSAKDMLAHITFWEHRLFAYVHGAKESLVSRMRTSRRRLTG